MCSFNFKAIFQFVMLIVYPCAFICELVLVMTSCPRVPIEGALTGELYIYIYIFMPNRSKITFIDLGVTFDS